MEIVSYCETLFGCELSMQYFFQTAFPEYHWCVVKLCLTFFLFFAVLVKFLLSLATLTL